MGVVYGIKHAYSDVWDRSRFANRGPLMLSFVVWTKLALWIWSGCGYGLGASCGCGYGLVDWILTSSTYTSECQCLLQIEALLRRPLAQRTAR